MIFDLAHALELLIGRLHGPLSFRLILQPLVAALLAVRAGLRDARAGRQLHLPTIISDRTRRGPLLAESWRDVSRLFIVAIVIDMVYQIMVFRWIYVGQTLIVATVVALPSYLLVRGFTNRIARRWLNRPDPALATTTAGAQLKDGVGDRDS